ncbi:hypothetical protein [Mycolicibacterium sp.]|uniref:hypothetical protein n=1 Tax=Mycolicibacterium sp. TaxID=2320850 RepID=UPI0037C6D985
MRPVVDGQRGGAGGHDRGERRGALLEDRDRAADALLEDEWLDAEVGEHVADDPIVTVAELAVQV